MEQVDRRPVVEKKKLMPNYEKGGTVAKTGKALVHKGEKVIPKNKVKEYGHLASALGGGAMSPPLSKGALSVTARVDSGMYNNNDYHRKEIKRLRGDIKTVQKEIGIWDSEKVAAQALRSLKTDLAMKKARLMECEAMLGEDSEESDSEDEEHGVPPEKKLPEGEVDGGPYGIRKAGSKWKVITLDGGKVHGTFDSREKALRQFRLLEMKYHEGE